jgi:ABC-type transport system involved in multi-copper enzyme maturation permease subunit
MIDRILALTLITFRESVRSKLLYTCLAFLLAIVLVSTPYARVTIGDPAKVVKDFGLAGIAIGSVLFVVISGGTMLQKELARKTIFVVLSRPVRRWEFLLGKFFGLTITTVCLISLMEVTFLGYLWLCFGEFDWRLLVHLPYASLEATIVAAAVILFSTLVVTPILNGLFAFGFYIAGRSVESVQVYASTYDSALARAAVAILPRLDYLSVAEGLAYHEVPSLNHLAWAVLYTVLYSSFLLLSAAVIFETRDIS